MFLRTILLSFYFTSLVTFSFVSHPVGYCLLLLTSAFSISGYAYLLFGFSWYLVLFCLVYVGGVYILFIFVSVHNPNPIPVMGAGLFWFFFFFFFFFACFSLFGGWVPFYFEASHYLCTSFEGLSYCFFCFIMILGFMIVSVVCSNKDSFFR